MTAAGPVIPVGTPVDGGRGEPLGHVATIYNDGATGRSVWAGVDGARGTAVVPLDGSTFDGTTLHVPYGPDHLRAAPPHSPGTVLTPSESAELRRHYGLTPPPPDRTAEQPPGDAVLTLSAEQVTVGREYVRSGRARLVTSIVTEDVTITVPVRRQVMHLEYDPVPVHEQVPATTAPAEAVHEVVRYEERVRVVTEVVPVERVRLVTRVVTTGQTVHGQLRHEEIDLQETGAPPVPGDARA